MNAPQPKPRWEAPSPKAPSAPTGSPSSPEPKPKGAPPNKKPPGKKPPLSKAPAKKAPQKKQAPPVKKPAPKPKPAAPKRPSPRDAKLQKLRQLQRRQLQRRLRIFSVYALCTLVVYGLFVGIISLGIFIKTHSFSKEEAPLPDVFIASPEQDRFSAKLSGTTYYQENLRHNDVLYLEVDLLSAYTAVAEGGNHSLRTVHINGEWATFYLGTPAVCINGQYTNLSAPSILRDSRLCVPLDFFETCLAGVQVRTDTEATVKDGELPRTIMEQVGEIGFVLQENATSDSIPYEVFLKEYNEQLKQNQKQ